MSKINTVKKGDSFENKVFDFFKREIEEDRFWVKKENCNIYQKKGYFSKDRNKDIVFDITIEIFLHDQKNYSLLLVIECKDYNKKVPVDDVEEFFAKVEQISSANTKLIMVSSNAFQEGAFNFSHSKGIGLLRYRSQENLDWILHRSTSSLVSTQFSSSEEQNVYKSLREDDFANNYFDCYAFFGYEYTNSLSVFLSRLIEYKIDDHLSTSLYVIQNTISHRKNLVEFIDDIKMEQITKQILQDIDYVSGKVDLERISQFLYEAKNIDVKNNQSLSKGILGEIDFRKNYILIDNTQCQTFVRSRFTLAHEIGHFLLEHSKYMDGEKFYGYDDLEKPLGIGIEDIKRMEWQANQFASYLLLPKENFLVDFNFQIKKHNIVDKGFGLLYLDKQRCNIDVFNMISSPLMQKYKVSRSVIKIRLKKLGLLSEPNFNRL